MTKQYRKLLRRFFLVLFTLSLLLFFFREPVLRRVANYLVVADPLEYANAIAVLAGSELARCRTAAALFVEGWAPLILITKGGYPENQKERQRYGISVPEAHDRCVAILRFYNVPEGAVEILDGYNESTADESAKLRQYLEKRGLKHVLIVTSNFHTRRARLLFRRALRDIDVQVSVRPTPPDSSFDPNAWWMRRRDSKVLLWEYQKLVFYTLRYW